MLKFSKTLRPYRKWRFLAVTLTAVLVVALVLVFGHVGAERVLAITPTLPSPTATLTPTATPTPTPVDAGIITFTNNTAQPAAHFVLIISTITVPATIVTQPAGCGTAEQFGGFEYVEFIWPAPCIGPGESIVLDTIDPAPFIVFTHSFAPSPPVVSAVNNKGFAAGRLVIDTTSTFGIAGALLIQNAPGCPQPILDEQSLQLTVVWSSACVDPGEKVAIHVAGGGAGGFNITNLPFQFVKSVGGLAVDLDGDLGELALETAQPSGGSAGLLAGIAAAVAAGAIAVGGAGWYARRRL